MAVMKELSVIIPVYNAENFLPRCLDSLLGQACASMEVIVVNDGSRDGSLAVCEDYAKKDARVLVLDQENRGTVAARNRGMEMAAGRYLLFVDADDYVSPGYLPALHAQALESGADIVFTRVCRVRGGSVVEESGYQEKTYACLAEKLALLGETYFPGPYAKIYKRSFLETNTLRFLTEEGYHGFAEDMLFALHAAYAAATIAYCPSASYCYCMDNEQSICSDPALQSRNNRDRLVVIRHMLDFAQEKRLTDDELLPLLQAVENHLRWGGKSTRDAFLRDPHFTRYPVFIQKYFQEVAENRNAREPLARRCRQRLKDALLQHAPAVYGWLRSLYALFQTGTDISLAADRGSSSGFLTSPEKSDPGIMVFIPAYNCERQIGRVLAQFSPEIASRFSEIVVVENRSSDNTLAAAREALAELAAQNLCKATLLQNDENYSLGGSHKVAFNYCLEQGYDYLAVLHGDDQGDIRDILPWLDNGDFQRHTCLLGARFAPASRLPGYSRFRIFGNIVFNALISLVTRTRVLDMGAGLNLYKAEFLASRFYLPFPDDLTFNVYMLYYTIWKKSRFRFFPLTWREDDQISNAKMFRQAAHILVLTWLYTSGASRLFDSTRPPGRVYASKNIPLGGA